MSLANPVAAATIVVNGLPDPGAAGADGADSWVSGTAGGPGGDGQAGGGAAAVADYETNGDLNNAAIAKGGAGGVGGSGGHGRASPSAGGDGGAGGAGGSADASARSNVGWGVLFGADASAMATAAGGRGGAGGPGGTATGVGAVSGTGGHGGRGGDARTAASAAIGPDSAVAVSVSADAGDGGSGGLPGAATGGATRGTGGSGGAGGDASLSADGFSAVRYAGFGRSVTVTASGAGGDGGAGFGAGQKGGDGGRADATVGSGMGEPGGGANSVVLLAGGGGGGGAFGAAGGAGGEARANGSASNAWDMGYSAGTMTATGGAGGASETERGGDGGVATATQGNFGHVTAADTRAVGGDGGGGRDGGHGGRADATSTAGLKPGGRSDIRSEAKGGRGGDGAVAGSGGDGGTAISIAESNGRGSAAARAVGGAGGSSGDSANGGAGGAATARVAFDQNRNSPGDDLNLSGMTYAEGGAGGAGRNGGDATATITVSYAQDSSTGSWSSLSGRLEAKAIGGAGGLGSGTEQGDAIANIAAPSFFPQQAEFAASANGRQARANISREVAEYDRHAVDAISAKDGVASSTASIGLNYFSPGAATTEAQATIARPAPSKDDLEDLTAAAVAVGLPIEADIRTAVSGRPNVAAAFDDGARVLGLGMFNGERTIHEGTTRTDFAIDMNALSGLPAGSRLTVGMLEGSVPNFFDGGSPPDWLANFTIEIDNIVFSYDFSPKSEEEIEEKRIQAMSFLNDNVIDFGPWQTFVSSDGILDFSYRFDVPTVGDYATSMIFGITSDDSPVVIPLPGALWLFVTALGVLFAYGRHNGTLST